MNQINFNIHAFPRINFNIHAFPKFTMAWHDSCKNNGFCGAAEFLRGIGYESVGFSYSWDDVQSMNLHVWSMREDEYTMFLLRFG